MPSVTQIAYRGGELAALDVFGIKEARILGTGAKILGKAVKWGGRLLGSIPLAGTAPGAVLGGVGGAIEGLGKGEGVKGMLARGAAGAATGALPLGSGLVAGAASDYALDKALAKKPTGPAPAKMPGMLGQSHLPGMVS